MISNEELINILNKPESTTLDFKEELYDFKNDKDLKNTSKFIKDVVSFSNTIRKETGFIIFGIKENNSSNELVGITKTIDDSILQDKVKNKVFPRPVFAYYELDDKGHRIGVLEFPVSKYEMPITPVTRMKGLEAGKAYYRNGSSNTEASALDVIRINNWLTSLPGNLAVSLSDSISKNLRRLSQGDEKLSVIIADLFTIAKEHTLSDLQSFCLAQISGIDNDELEHHKYRVQKVFMSLSEIETNPHSFLDITSDLIRKEMEKDDQCFEFQMMFNQPIVELEGLRKRFNNKTIGKIKKSSKSIFGKGDYNVNVFFFDFNIEGVYGNIRQKAIDELMKI